MLLARILAIAVFFLMFGCIMSGKIERYIPAIVAGAFVLIFVFLICMRNPTAVLESLNIKSLTTPEFWYPGHSHNEASSGINWSTIIFISGMMIMVEGMGKAGFFRVICSSLAKAVHYKVTSLFIVFMILSAFLSMFIDSITVILFLAAITVELGKMLKFDPTYLIIPEIFAANLGGAATMSGDPPNIIIGTSLGYTFFDFLEHTGPIAWVSLIFVIIYFYFAFKKKLPTSNDSSKVSESFLEGNINRKDFAISSVIFFFVVLLLVTHSMTGLSVATIGVIAAVLTLLTSMKHAKHIIKAFDWKTIVFFIGLFLVVSGLEQTGILKFVSGWISSISGGNPVIVVIIIIWVSAILSAIVDNIPFAATMVPVIQGLASTIPGMDLSVLAYALAIGTDVGGNATPIGASANVVGTSIAAENGHPITWDKYCKYCIPATIITLTISTVMILLIEL